MSTLIDPASNQAVLPGTIGLTSISGEVGRLIRLGQYLAETPEVRWLRRDYLPNYQHAFVYLGADEYGVEQLIEAEPGGARIRPVSEYGSDIYWCMNIAGEFTPAQLAGVAQAARDFENVGYSFLDYDALFMHRLHIPVPGLRDFIKSTGHVICSQLCDASYQARDLQIFTDNRWPGYVMPMDLYLRDRSLAIRAEYLSRAALWATGAATGTSLTLRRTWPLTPPRHFSSGASCAGRQLNLYAGASAGCLPRRPLPSRTPLPLTTSRGAS